MKRKCLLKAGGASLTGVVLLAFAADARSNFDSGPDARAKTAASEEYRYFKESVPLSVDPRTIAVLQRSGDPRAELAAAGLAVERLEPWPVAGWSLATFGATQDGDVDVRGAVALVAESSDLVEFASPVLHSAHGTLILTSDLLVGFREDVSIDAAGAALAAVANGTIIDAHFGGMPNVHRVRCQTRNGFDVLHAANALAQREDVRFAEPDSMRTVLLHGNLPDDPHFFRQWGLHNEGQNIVMGLNELCCARPCTGPCFPGCPDMCIAAVFGITCDKAPGVVPDFDMDVPEAWEITTGDPSVIIAVLDEGVQMDHPDLLLDPALGQDFTGTGGGGAAVTACDDHGTIVVGTMFGRMNNGIGGVGIAPGCTVAVARVIEPLVPCVGQQGVVMPSWEVEALAWAESIGARATNQSYGVPPSAAVAEKLLQTRKAGMLHFASVGNSGGPPVSFPANAEGVNGVSALDPYLPGLADFSTFGPGVDFSAPGLLVWTTDVQGDVGAGYFFTGSECNEHNFTIGTSLASPLVAGTALLVLSVSPQLSADSVEQVLRESAVDLGTTGFDIEYGWGFVNAGAAVARAAQLVADIAPPGGDGVVDGADLGVLLGAWGPCPAPCPADLSRDGVVDGADLGVLLGLWSEPKP